MRGLIKSVLGHILEVVFALFPIRKNKIFFETGIGEVKDNTKAVYDYLRKNYKDQYILKWAVRKGSDVSEIDPGEIVWKKTFGYYYHLMTSKYWIRTHSVDNIVRKREGQIYIQLWHGPGATKKEGFDTPGIENTGETMWHAREWDYYIATDPDSRDYIKTAVNLKIPRLLLGSPRSDRLVNMDPGEYKRIREELGIREGETAVLYAPTFREEDFNRTKIELKVKKLCALDGVRVILRLHPEVKSRMDISEYDSSVIDGNGYPDIFELYMASDIMVTDYSSVSIEYSLLKRPILYYMYDLEEYTKERDFYFNYLERLSGLIVRTEEELIRAVENIDGIMEEYHDRYEAYYDHYNRLNDGHVCERFCRLLSEGFFDRPGNDCLPEYAKKQ
ncbi:CDP-glycerol glycerophosphotransferase family protein [Ruminococcus sp. CLA-AA-H200]|uniref:CDP-glycerol glycerophosphotransferase family protein n=1 Tax=Ruminococcus turbiniformis TaxID=2881258 RepID=A0ABS8FVS0_9FIRM|nr:CDP-glycerol glycerophosphotransferase family protein [Ruminococcus turbiniformis]MCC2254135.1 CDP-glycerol glycerophosphotransferase family protein [Ruminococcus turbiniformis]